LNISANIKNAAALHFMPQFEDRIGVLSLVNGPFKVESNAVDFVMVLDSTNSNKGRVHCQVLEITGTVQDAVFDSLSRTSECILLNQSCSDSLLKQLNKVWKQQPQVILACTRTFGKTLVEAKKNCAKLGSTFVKNNDGVEVAARIILLCQAKSRGETKGVIVEGCEVIMY
jgi:hypothetical protein